MLTVERNMIDKLTKNQITRFPEFVEKWTAIGLTRGMNDRLPETILIRMSNRTLKGATLEAFTPSGIPIYQLQDYDNSSRTEEAPEASSENRQPDKAV